MICSNVLREVRNKFGYTQEDVGKILNVKRSTYKEYELGNSSIPLKHLNEFCNYFNISIDYAYGYTDKIRYNCYRNDVNVSVVGARLRNLRKKNNLTLVDLAGVMRSDYTLISKYEKGVCLINSNFLFDLCRKFKVSADYILGKIDNPDILK